MPRLRICSAIFLAVVLAQGASDAWAADIMPLNAPKPTASTEPVPCTTFWDFVATKCPLTWYGITLYGTVDAGYGWQSHGAPWDRRSAPGASYLLQRQNRSPLWSLAPNALSQSAIGLKGTIPGGNGFSFVFAWDTGFDPYSLRLANGPGSIRANIGVPQDQQTAWADSSRAGQWYNGVGYVGLSSPEWGTLTVFRQNSLTLDAVIAYDPLGASYAFSPIGFSGLTCGVGDTEDCRFSTAAKYRLNMGQARVAVLWQFGGYAQNNAANGAYQFQFGGDIPNLANGVLSLDAIYSFVRDAVSLSPGPGTLNAAGAPIPPFLPQLLTATISDDTSLMVVGRYTNGPVKLYAGYEWIRYARPSDPQVAFNDIAGDLICLGCAAINGTNINNTAYGVNGLGDRIEQVMWVGGRYSITEDLEVMAGYYHYFQQSFFGTVAGGFAPCSGSEHSQCSGTFNAISAVIDWRFAPKWDVYLGAMYSEFDSGLANGFFKRNNIDPTVGLRFRF